MSSGNRIGPFAMGLLLVAYAGARLVTAPPIVEKPRVLADSTAYTRISGLSIGSIDFWAASRPAAFPLLLKIAGQDYDRAAAIQLCISIVAWMLLALMVSRFLRPAWLEVAGSALILLFSLDRHIVSWDFVMMTESLSLSSLALFIAASLWLLKGWNPAKVVLFFLAALLLAFTRDTNAWLLLGLAGLLLIALFLRWLPLKSWILVVLLGVVYLLGHFSATLGERWLFPLGNLITQRVLPDPAAVQDLEACGMPVSPALMQLSGGFANSDDQAMFSGRDLDSFRYWLLARGRNCYVGWLMADPITSMRAAMYQTGGLIAFTTVDRFYSNRYVPLLPEALGNTLYPGQLTLWIWGVTTLAALIAIWRRSWRQNALWSAFVCMSLLVFPHLFVTWHGDAMAPDRHALSVGVQLYLGFWLLVLLLIQYAQFRMQSTDKSRRQRHLAP